MKRLAISASASNVQMENDLNDVYVLEIELEPLYDAADLQIEYQALTPLSGYAAGYRCCGWTRRLKQASCLTR